MIAELDGTTRIGLDQLPQSCPLLHYRIPPQILLVEVEEIEVNEHDAVRRLVDGRAQGVEVRNAVLVTVNQRRLAGQLGDGADNPAIGSGAIHAGCVANDVPIKPIPPQSRLQLNRLAPRG
jgi:hypothetical protein